MNLVNAMRSSASGMSAERARMDLVSVNLANANSMTTPFQEAYRRRIAVLSGGPDGVKIDKFMVDESPLRVEVDPDNEYADAEGKVYYSNVQPIKEMVDMMSATRAYEANIAAFNSAKSMAKAAMTIGKA